MNEIPFESIIRLQELVVIANMMIVSSYITFNWKLQNLFYECIESRGFEFRCSFFSAALETMKRFKIFDKILPNFFKTATKDVVF